MVARTFEELFAWQLAAELRDAVLAICATGVLNSDIEFRDQLRAAACAAPRLIAEGFGRFGRREFRHYLAMARGELLEVRNDLLDLQNRRWISSDEIERLLGLTDHATRVTARLRSSIRDVETNRRS